MRDRSQRGLPAPPPRRPRAGTQRRSWGGVVDDCGERVTARTRSPRVAVRFSMYRASLPARCNLSTRYPYRTKRTPGPYTPKIIEALPDGPAHGRGHPDEERARHQRAQEVLCLRHVSICRFVTGRARDSSGKNCCNSAGSVVKEPSVEGRLRRLSVRRPVRPRLARPPRSRPRGPPRSPPA
jgi:hypothetical protein